MKIRAIWVLVSLTVFGCRSMPETHYYTLVVPSELVVPSDSAVVAPGEATAGAGRDDVRLGVETFVVDPPYDQGLLVYRLGSDSVEVGFYDYHRWASPLGGLVAAAFVEGLQDSPGAAVSELAMSERSYSAVLNGRVVYLEGVDTPRGQNVRFKIELSLESPEGELLWRQTLTSDTTIQAASATEIVDQLQRDLSRLVVGSRQAIGKALADEPG